MKRAILRNSAAVALVDEHVDFLVEVTFTFEMGQGPPLVSHVLPALERVQVYGLDIEEERTCKGVAPDVEAAPEASFTLAYRAALSSLSQKDDSAEAENDEIQQALRELSEEAGVGRRVQ